MSDHVDPLALRKLAENIRRKPNTQSLRIFTTTNFAVEKPTVYVSIEHRNKYRLEYGEEQHRFDIRKWNIVEQYFNAMLGPNGSVRSAQFENPCNTAEYLEVKGYVSLEEAEAINSRFTEQFKEEQLKALIRGR